MANKLPQAILERENIFQFIKLNVLDGCLWGWMHGESGRELQKQLKLPRDEMF